MCLCMDNVWLDLIERRNKKEEGGGKKRRIAIQITLIKRLLLFYGVGLLLKEIRNDYQKKKEGKHEVHQLGCLRVQRGLF